MREEKFVDMHPELLYIYASFYIHLFKGQKIDEVNDMKDALKDLDDTWAIAGNNNEHLKEEGFTERLISKFFYDEKRGEILTVLNEKYFDNVSKLNLQKKYIKLHNSATEEKSKDLFLGVLPTAHKLGQLQSRKIGIDYTLTDKIITIGCLGLTGVVVVAFGIAFPFIGDRALNDYEAYLINTLKELFRDFEGYKSNIKILLEAFNINPEKQYLYFQEKGIALNQELQFIYSHKDEEIIEKWNKIFENSFHLKNIETNDKKNNLIKFIRSIKINFRIKDILLKDHFFGIFGKEKSGKSTFTEVIITDETANSSQSEKTKELKSFKIDERTKFTFFDYPHFESEDDLNHKLQFLFTRHLVDYLFVVFDASQTDNADGNNFLKLAREYYGTRFTVLLNRADKFWMHKSSNRVIYTPDETFKKLEDEMYKKIEANAGTEEITKRVFFTCLNYDDYNGNEIDSLKKKDHIYTANKLRKLVFSKFIDQISKFPNFDENKSILTDRLNQLEELHNMKQKMIWIKKKLNPIKVHIINRTESCKIPGSADPPLDHYDCKTLEELIIILKEEFGIKIPILKTQNEDKTVESIQDILTVDTHCFIVSENLH
jgi:hypothetical protein